MKNLKETKKMRENGITLVALVITIVILLILAGISISTLTNTGIFQKAKEAKQKSEEAENEQNKILDEYETELNQYNENTLVYKVNNGIVKIGDYVAYTPDDASTKEILEELGNYSGSKENTNLTLTQEKNLNWRVLDVKDGCVRLISEMPTTSSITLKSAMGYNNAVYLLDKTCKILYSNQLASNVQNLKREDIQKFLTYDYTQYTNSKVDTGKYGGTKECTENRWYPNIFSKEKTAWVDGVQGTEYDLSEQTEPINSGSTYANTNIKMVQTLWDKLMVSNYFKESIYYNLFIKHGKSDSTYWLSTRCVDAGKDDIGFYIACVDKEYVKGDAIYASLNGVGSYSYSFRPVVTLNSGVQLDATKVADGSDADHAYAIK